MKVSFFRDFMTVKERLETLFGVRGKVRDHAVRKGDLSAARSVQTNAQKVDAPPTADEHNALVDDVRRLRDALDKVSRA